MTLMIANPNFHKSHLGAEEGASHVSQMPVNSFFQSLIGARVLSRLKGMLDFEVVVEDLKINIAMPFIQKN